jgi:hypothetical protein
VPDEIALDPEGTEPTVDSTDGAPEPEVAQPEQEALDFLELDDSLASKYVKLTIEGQEVPVKLSDALRGYNSERVSTQRFQEAAELRKQAEIGLRIQQALETDPEMTLRILAQRAGLSPAQFIQQAGGMNITDLFDKKLEALTWLLPLNMARWLVRMHAPWHAQRPCSRMPIRRCRS